MSADDCGPLQLSNSESVWRETPSPSAAAVTDRPSSFTQASRMISPNVVGLQPIWLMQGQVAIEG